MNNIEEDIKPLKGIDIKFLLSGSIEQNNYIVDEADKINQAIEHILSDIQSKNKKKKNGKSYIWTN